MSERQAQADFRRPEPVAELVAESPAKAAASRQRRRWSSLLAVFVLLAVHQLVPEGTRRLSRAAPQETVDPTLVMPRTLAPDTTSPAGGRVAWAQSARDPLALLRYEMVEKQIRDRGVKQRQVLEAMREVPRHEFVDPDHRGQAYEDKPVPIGWGQTIYQPYMVALMTELLELDGDERVLEIGTGSGYHSAVLSRVASQVYTIEINQKLFRQARRNLSALGYSNIVMREGDGYLGWPEEAPFDAIILTAAPPRIPEPLIEQLKVGGKMVVPVGGFLQNLQVLTKTDEGVIRRKVAPVRVSTMTGEVQKQR